MTAAPVERIGRYRLDGVVGTGGFATVYRAVDDRLDDTVAVKVLAENRSFDLEYRERFLTEGRVLRRIDSAHVVRVHDLGETDRHQPYLVLEYADRGTLAGRARRLRERGWRPGPDDIRALVEPLTAAVEAVHRADVVHRDLSPGNVLLASTMAPAAAAARSTLVGEDERLLLADLGLCKDLALHSGHTLAGGTEGFRPPEQRAGLAVVDHRADLWSLSALLVWLVTGEPPDDEAVRDRIAAAGLPAQLGEVLDVGLALDPAARHPNVRAWREAVDEALRPPPSPPVTGSPTSGAAGTSPSPEGGSPSIAAPTVDGGTAGAGPAAGRSSAPWRHRWSPARMAVAAVAVALVLVVAVLVRRTWFAGDGVDVTRLENGNVRVAQSRDGVTVAFVGPAQVEVEESVQFRVDMDEQVEQWTWIGPDAGVHANAPRLEIRAQSPGVAPVTLIGVLPSREQIQVTYDLRVTGG